MIVYSKILIMMIKSKKCLFPISKSELISIGLFKNIDVSQLAKQEIYVDVIV